MTLCLIAIALAAETRPTAGARPDLGMRLLEAQQRRDSQIGEIRSVRRYVLHNPRWKSDPSMDVAMTWDGRSPKRFQITSVDAEGFQKRVFQRLLEEESASSIRGHEDSAITGANYAMQHIGSRLIDGRPCEVVQLQPKRKTKLTIEGQACIDVHDAAVVMMQGRTAKSLSFWVGHAEVNQEFRKLGDFWVPWYNHSTANVKFLAPLH